jgi:hypothetical protein
MSLLKFTKYGLVNMKTKSEKLFKICKFSGSFLLYVSITICKYYSITCVTWVLSKFQGKPFI